MFFRVLLTGMTLVVGMSSVEAGVIDRFARAVQGQHNVCAPCVRVLVVHDAANAMIDVSGKYAIVDPNRHEVLARRLHGKQRMIEAKPQGLKWGEEFPDIYQLKLVPTAPETIISVNGVPYPGIVSIYDVGGTISIVNDVDIEDYVSSMVASKIDHAVPKEALAAIAIAQRTEVYYRTNNPRNAYWDIDGIAAGYQGLHTHPHYDAADQAVDATSYMVLNLDRPESHGQEKVGLFPARWAVTAPLAPAGKQLAKKPTLLLSEAEHRASQGQNAAQILSGTFPGVTVKRMFTVN